MSRLLLSGLMAWFVMLPTSSLLAHFIWVVSDNGVAKIYFGEGPEPEQAEYLDGLSGLRAFRFNGSEYESVDFVKQTSGDEGWFQFSNELNGPVSLTCDYGLFRRGETNMRLEYSARYQSSHHEVLPNDQMRLDILPKVMNGELQLQVRFDGKPAAGVEITVFEGVDQAEPLTLKTDVQGVASLPVKSAGRLVVRGKKVLATSGEWNGQAYSEQRFYCNVVMDLGDSSVEASGISSSDSLGSYLPDLPMPITSFAATQVGDAIYVLGGQMGDAHDYARSWQNGKLLCLNTRSPHPVWQEIDEGRGAQGLALVAHGNRLFRLGGFEARNEEGADHDLHSLDAFRCFDLTSQTWTDLPALPEPRSSFDACVVGDKVFVVGGWSLRGAEPTVWCETALVYDLSEANGHWETLPTPPFKRRALSVVACENQIFAIGGIGIDGKTSSAVNVFDLARNEWLTCPPLPDCGSLKGFGCCAFLFNGSVVVSVSDGQFFRFDRSAEQWSPLAKRVTPGRFFHRVFPLSEATVAVVGGANMEIGKFSETELIELD